MNIESIGRLISTRYQDVQSIGSGPVFRASYSHHQVPVGIYYFDCSQSILHPTFDIGEYQEQLLSDEYYGQSGPLQWNLYLYLLCDDAEYIRLLDEGLVSRIESDGIYAKKYVTSEELLRQELALRTEKWHREAADLPEDISARWLGTLDRHGLAEAADQSVSGKEVFRRYMNESSPAAPTRRKKKVGGGAAVLGFVSGLQIAGQRPYPLEKEFDFGPVNLIEGANGAGKTSLLEAIELWTCGRTFRNQDGRERADDIRLKLNGTYEKGRKLGDNELYRSRDLLWYGQHQSKGTDLCSRFNRFNFYNTDAAFHITNASDSNTINRAIADLVLGEQANIIESRLGTLLSYFEPEYRANKRDAEEFEAQIKEANEALDSLGSAPGGRDESLAELKAELARLGLKIAADVEDEEIVNRLSREVNKMTARVEELRGELEWLPAISLSSISNESKRLEVLLNEVERITRDLVAGRQQLDELRVKIETLKSDLVELSAWQRYLFNKSAHQLQGLEESINQVRKHIKACNEASEVVADIDIVKYLEVNEFLQDVEEHEKKRERKLQTEIGKLKLEARQIEKDRGRISTLLTDIREKSRQLIKLNPKLNSCPVCSSAFEIGQLAELLSADPEKEAAPGLALDVQARLSQAEIDASDASERLDELQRLRYAYSLIVIPEEEIDWRLSVVGKRLLAIRDELSRMTQEMDEMTWSKERLQQDGLTENEYESLRMSVRAKFPDAPLTYEHRAKLAQYKLGRERTLKEQESAIQEIEAKLSESTSKQEALYKEFFATSAMSVGFDAELKKHVAQLQKWEPIYRDILSIIGVSPAQDVTDVSVLLWECRIAFERYADSRKLHERTAKLRASYESKRQSAESKLPESRRRRDLAGQAINVINSILVTDNKDSHLQKFFELNTKDIFEIYRLMHAPREFTGVEYDEKDGKILLIRNSGERSLLTQISSGQRAALSMSIFLALNRKLRNGPPFLLLDDPVALVDDLNVLSFLDYLRDIVIAGERQVFFATANKKVATLFRKKFAFLKEEFKDHKLNR